MKKILPLALFASIFWNGYAQTGNVGVGNTTPVTKLDVAGDLALREGTAIGVSGANPTVAVTLTTANPENSFYRITGSPTGTMTLNSIANGVDGQIITLVNATTIKLKISNNNAASGILTSGGAATLIAPNGSITLQYSSGATRWYVTNAAGATITDWIKAITADEPAISTDAQYVMGNVGLGGHLGAGGDNGYSFANNAPAVPLVVVSPGIAAAASTPTTTGLRLAMPGTSGSKWPLSADFKLGSYATTLNSQSQLDIALGNGGTATPDVTVMSILGNKNVGIGITTPQNSLHIVQSGATSAITNNFAPGITLTSNSASASAAGAGFYLENTAATSGARVVKVVNQIFNASNNGSFTLQSVSDNAGALSKNLLSADLGTGNVGINNVLPQYKLDVNGTGLFRNGGANTATSGNDQVLFGYSGGNSYMQSIRSRHNSGSDASNAIDFYTWDQGVDGVNSLPTKFNMTINGGNVGIGTNEPTNQLEIAGSTGSLELGAGGWLDPGTGSAGICADNSSFKTLMIVGNKATGNLGQNREVQVWDYLKVNGYVTVGTQANATATNPPSGTMRYNSTRSCMEYWNGTYWICMGAPTVQRVTVRDQNDETYAGTGCNSCSGWGGSYGATYTFTVNNLYAGQKVMFYAEIMFDNDTKKNGGFPNATKIYGNNYFGEIEVVVPGSWETVQTKVFPAQTITSTGNLTFTFESNTGITDVRITAVAY